VLSFIINPEKDYTIYDIEIESDINRRDKFKKDTYILEKDKENWEKNRKNVQDEEKKFYNFSLYFKNKFFTDFTNKSIDEKDTLNKYDEIEETESIRIFKRDKLLAKN
jgi:hypothetical protein